MNDEKSTTSRTEKIRPPHEQDSPVVASRRGRFWVPGKVRQTSAGTVQAGPLYVEWEAPEKPVSDVPLLLIHGGGGQGTDWLTTPDGRPGWASRFVEAGRIVYVVDRPGHGRSPYHPDVIGEMGAPFPYEAAEGLFSPEAAAEEQTQWSFGHGPGDESVDQLVAAMGPLPKDLSTSQQMDRDRIAALLDRTGPAVLITHSAGGPAGWLAADARPELVRGIIAVEPVGPPFATVPGIGELGWGLTAAAVSYRPEMSTADEARITFEAGQGALTVPAWEGLPVSLVTGGASAFADFADQVVAFLKGAGADAVRLHLPELGIEGNGHGLIFEHNSDEIAARVLAEIDRRMLG